MFDLAPHPSHPPAAPGAAVSLRRAEKGLEVGGVRTEFGAGRADFLSACDPREHASIRPGGVIGV